VRGGLDVARRTLAPRLRIQPGFKNYRLQLNDPSARILFTNCLSLLPGTLAARLDGNHVELHLLDAGEDPEPGLRRLEQAIARLFGLFREATNV
jgi:multicomponent Na+:H+ antiporter subunit E